MNLFLYIPLFLSFYLITKHLFNKLRNLPPMPFLSFPYIGHLYLLKKPFHRTLANLSEEYGPVFYLSFGSKPVLIISSPTAAKQCLQHNDALIPENPQLIASKIIGHSNAKLLNTPSGLQWRALRRILGSDLIFCGSLDRFHITCRDEVNLFINRLYIQSSIDEGSVEVKRGVFELTYRIIMRMVGGVEWCDGDNGKRFGIVLEEMVKVGKSTNVIIDFMPFLRKFGYENYLGKLFESLHGEVDKLLQGLIDEERLKIERDCEGVVTSSDAKKTVVQVMLALQQKDPINHSDEIIKGLVLILLIAGADTCSTAIEWAISLLLNNPSILSRAQEEIDEHVGHDRLIKEQDLSNKLNYLNCIVKETLRMYPAGPLLLPHETSKTCLVEGYHIPKGTLLLLNLWAIHNNADYWPDPSEFKPERFEGTERKIAEYKFMDIGSTTSHSPVESMFIRMGSVALGTLLQCFEWERNNSEMLVNLDEGAFLTMSKAQPLRAKIRPRQTMSNLIS